MMGWGCYKHEWDDGSEAWAECESALCERKLSEEHRTFGRDGRVCPACYEELEADNARLLDALASRDLICGALQRALGNEGTLLALGFDPERVARSMKQIEEGKTISLDELRAALAATDGGKEAGDGS